MRGGNNRLPRTIKEQRGTIQKCRDNKKAPRLTYTKVPPPPKDMDPNAKAIWKELAECVDVLKVYTPAHAVSFRILVETVIDTRDPELSVTTRMRSRSSASAQIARFGLDPASNDRVSQMLDEANGQTEDFLFGGKLAANG